MRSYTTRLEQLERAVAPAPDAIHILRPIVDPHAPGDRITEVVARGDDGTPATFPRSPGETKDQLCERAERVMGWA